jgi:hypothetical protein
MNTRSIWERFNMSFMDKDYSPSASMWKSCPQLAGLDPATVSTFFDDFHSFQINNANELGWISTEVENGAGDAALTIADAANGVLQVVNDAGDDDSVELQYCSECWKLAAGKPLWFEARAKFSDATQSDFLVGLTITDTTAITAVSDGVYFTKTDGSASISAVTNKNSTPTTTAAVGTLVDDTYMRLGIFCDGITAVYFFIDGVLVATHTANIVDDEELTITLAHRNGAAAAKTASYDYVKVVNVR